MPSPRRLSRRNHNLPRNADALERRPQHLAALVLASLVQIAPKKVKCLLTKATVFWHSSGNLKRNILACASLVLSRPVEGPQRQFGFCHSSPPARAPSVIDSPKDL